MLDIRVLSREGRCPSCEDSGVVLPSKQKLITYVGTFCPNCKAGDERWAKTLEIVSEVDKELSIPSLLPPLNRRGLVPRSYSTVIR